MAVTDQDRHTPQVSGESTSGGPKRLAVDDDGKLIGTSDAAIKTAVEALNTALQTGGISQVQFAAMVTALQIIDNSISGNETQVDVVAALPAGTNIIGAEAFGGAVYTKVDTAAVDTARRFETTSKKLRDVIIQVATYAQLFGDSAEQAYSVGVGDTLGFTKVDISTLYFKNSAAGQNGVVRILAVLE